MKKVTSKVRSMTGFGEARGVFNGGDLVVELTSLNHRFFDLFLSVPATLNLLEIPLRKKISQRLGRGRVRMNVRFAGGFDPASQLVLNEARVSEYLQYYAELRSKFHLPGELDAQTLLMAPAVVGPPAELADRDGLQHTVEALCDTAMNALEAMQHTEGQALASDLKGRLDKLASLSAQIKELAPAAKESYRKSLKDRLRQLQSEASVSPERIAVELVLFAERSDITEELVRIQSHLEQADETLREGGEVGHRLDFIAQELGREINTAGAKAASPEISRLIVDFKEELARVREQLQNLY